MACRHRKRYVTTYQGSGATSARCRSSRASQRPPRNATRARTPSSRREGLSRGRNKGSCKKPRLQRAEVELEFGTSAATASVIPLQWPVGSTPTELN
eukprot:988339-Amphidinium_carterae.1